MRIVLLGPPGAGKGTLAGLIKDSLDIEHISTGDIFRDEMKHHTALGAEMKKYVERGELVPDEVVTKIVENKLKNPIFEKGYMLDGFPRTSKQAKDLDEILNRMSTPIDFALYMEADLELIVQRLTGRRVCRKCGAVYHVQNRPAKVEGVCDVCGGELYQRADDNEETIRKRMEVYYQSTTPIVEYYRSQNKLRQVDGNKDSAELCKDVLKMLDEKQRHKN